MFCLPECGVRSHWSIEACVYFSLHTRARGASPITKNKTTHPMCRFGAHCEQTTISMATLITAMITHCSQRRSDANLFRSQHVSSPDSSNRMLSCLNRSELSYHPTAKRKGPEVIRSGTENTNPSGITAEQGLIKNPSGTNRTCSQAVG